jgi:hypothetical protein
VKVTKRPEAIRNLDVPDVSYELAMPNPLPAQISSETASQENPQLRVIDELFAPERRKEYVRFAKEKYGGLDYYSHYSELILGTGKLRSTGKKGPLTMAVLTQALGTNAEVMVQSTSFYTHVMAQQPHRESLKTISLPGKIGFFISESPLDGINGLDKDKRFDAITLRDPDPGFQSGKWSKNWIRKDMEDFAEAMIGRLKLESEHPKGASVFIGTKASTIYPAGDEGNHGDKPASKPEMIRFLDVFMNVLERHKELEVIPARGNPYQTAGEGEEGNLIFISKAEKPQRYITP